jgi:hypothetical protein
MPGVAVPLPVTGRNAEMAGLGTISAIISIARATAVLFMLAKDKSCVVRAWRSARVGGDESMLTSTNIIHAMPEQSRSIAMA